jgi:rubrerythrin
MFKLDTFEFAVKMEIDSREYYERQATLHSQPELKAVFDMLAQEEAAHAALLTDSQNGLPFKRAEPERPGLKTIFSGMADFKSDIKKTPSAVDVYRVALDKEQQSIDLYKKMLADASGGRELFEFLIRQEKKHYEIIEEIVKLVDRPNSWVESAEFGLREEY